MNTLLSRTEALENVLELLTQSIRISCRATKLDAYEKPRFTYSQNQLDFSNIKNNYTNHNHVREPYSHFNEP